MPKKKSKKSAKVVPTAGSPRSSRRRERMPVRRSMNATQQAAFNLVLLNAKKEQLRQCQRELAALREENTRLRHRLQHFAPGAARSGSPHGGGRRTYRRRRRRRRRRSRRSVPG